MGFVDGRALLIRLLHLLGIKDSFELTTNKEIELRSFDPKRNDFTGKTVYIPAQFSVYIRESLKNLLKKTAETLSKQQLNFLGIAVTEKSID